LSKISKHIEIDRIKITSLLVASYRKVRPTFQTTICALLLTFAYQHAMSEGGHHKAQIVIGS